MRRDDPVDGERARGDAAGDGAPAGFDVPPGADAVRCSRCGQPFVRERHLALHRGLAHGDDLTEAERTAFETAREEERDDIRHFRIVALGLLVLVYFGFLFAYALIP
ncbi:MAG: C2H2-type zinc finger protein [Haloferacaceae archaeon]